MKIIRFLKPKKAVTLVEILLACVLMAGAFLPIMGMMSSSIKATEQDENTQRAVMLCQEKLNSVLQMPFNKFPVSSTPITNGRYNSNQIVASFGAQIIEGVTFTSSLKVEPYVITYNVPTCDFTRKGDRQFRNNPNQWGFSNIAYTVTDKVKRFTVTVNWTDKGRSNQKFYTLSSLKADIRDN
jgi:hypothetical protein